MSDIDSEISEEIVEDYPSDGSDLYNPLEADYDVEEPTPPPQRVTTMNPTIVQRVIAPVPALTTRYDSSALKRPDESKILSAPKSDESYNEYSTVFDDYENDFDEYSNEFEEEKSTLEKQPPANNIEAATSAAASWLPPQISQLVQSDSQALQAELALQEISKEVVRLRNQQRNLLQERRRIAREKKLRAEARRAHYQVELKALRDRATEAEAENFSLKETVESLQRDLEISENNRSFLKSSINFLESTIKDLNDNINERQLEIESLRSKIIEDEALTKEVEKSWSTERTILKEEILRCKLQAELAMKNVDENNAR
jgi:chromosome segregation ATPase